MTVAELAIEAFFPADAATAQAVRAFVAGRAEAPRPPARAAGG